MAEHTTRGRTQDRAKVAGGQKHQTAYEATKTRATPEAVPKAVNQAGTNMRAQVEAMVRKGPTKATDT